MRHSVLCATLLASLCSGPVAAAEWATIGAWHFSIAKAGEAVPPGKAFAGSTEASNAFPLYTASNTTVMGTHLDGERQNSLDFSGWQAIADNGTVDATASMLSTDRQFQTAPRGGQDGKSDVFDPTDQDFSVSVWVEPADAAAYPLGSRALADVSPNIVQKGRIDEAGGFWKMSLGLARDGAGRLRWYPYCSFRNADHELNPGVGSGRYLLAPGQPVKIECVKVGGTASVRVYTSSIGSAAFTMSRSTPGNVNFSIANTASLSLGHKPRTTDPGDVYAGILDNLVIRKRAR